jgi:predicted alpha/beta-hydrolase family hydrolase
LPQPSGTYKLEGIREEAMWTNNQLRPTGHRDRQIQNRYFRPDPPSAELAVIIAGFGYTMESPYLFYSKHVPYRHGSDVLILDLGYSTTGAFLSAPEQERESWFQDDAAAVAQAVGELPYERLSLIGKSLGTTLIYGMVQQERFSRVTRRAVWLTPGRLHAQIEELMLTTELPSLAVYGEQDRLAHNTDFDALAERANVELMVVPGADHALETDDVFASVSHLSEYVRRLDAFWISTNTNRAGGPVD